MRESCHDHAKLLQTLFEMALGATSKLLRNRIITSSDDRIAVYIIGSVCTM